MSRRPAERVVARPGQQLPKPLVGLASHWGRRKQLRSPLFRGGFARLVLPGLLIHCSLFVIAQYIEKGF